MAIADDPRLQALVRELHAEDLPRNEIARRIGQSPRTVTRIAQKLGLAFDREATKRATAARVADGRARRAALVVALLDDAERMRQSLWRSCSVYNFGGRDNTYEERQHDEPDFAAKLKIMQAVGIAIDRSVKLDEYDSGDTGQVGSLLGNLFDSLRATHGTGDDGVSDVAADAA